MRLVAQTVSHCCSSSPAIVSAFDLLSANAIIPDTVVLNAATLRAVRMPARDHFVPDNRKPNATMKE